MSGTQAPRIGQVRQDPLTKAKGIVRSLQPWGFTLRMPDGSLVNVGPRRLRAAVEKWDRRRRKAIL